MIFTLAFWQATFERAISTAAQAALAMVTAAGIGVLDVDWGSVGSVAGLAAVAAVLKALAAAGIGQPGPGFGDAETLTPTVAAVKAPAEVPSEFQAGPAAHVPEGDPVQVVPDDTQAYSGDSKLDATYHGKHED